MATRTVSVALVADVGQYVTGMTRASASTKAFGSSTQQTQEQTRRGFDLAGKGAIALGAAAAGAAIGLKASIGAASDLNETLNKSNVIFGQNAGQIERWAQNSARDFGLSKAAALEAAASFGNMLQQLGFTGDEAVTASTGVVKLAADLGSFNNLETGDVLDRIGAAMRGEYDSLQLLIPNINAARVETEALTATGKENKDALTAQEKAAAVLAIVNRDGAAAANDFAETSDGLANATKIAKAEFENLQAEIGQRFLPIASSAMQFVSNTALPAIGGFADIVFGLANAFGDLPGPVQLATVAAVGWAVAGDRIMGGLRGVGGALSPMRDGFRAFGEALDYARANGDGLGTTLRSVGDYAGGQMLGGLRSLGRAIGPELGIAAAVIGIGSMVNGFRQLDEATDAAKDAQQEFASAVRESSGAIDENVRQAAAKAAQDSRLLDSAESMGISLSLVTDAVLGNTRAYDEVIAASEAYLQQQLDLAAGDPTDASFQNSSEAVRLFRNNLGELAPTVQQNAADQRQLAAATDQSGGAAGAAVDPVADYAAELEGAAKAADSAKKQTDAFKLSLDILTGATVTMIQIEAAFQAAVDEADGALENMNGTVLDGAGDLNLQSEAGRRAADVLLGVRDSGNQLIAQMIQQGRSADEVREKDAELRDSFIATARQMGISRADAERLTDQILGIPSERETKIEADTQQAESAVANVQSSIDNLKGRTVEVQVRAAGRFVVNPQGGLQEFAEGGWTGPGSKYQPAGIVHADEFVVPKSRVNALGGPQAVGALVGMPGYADGGPVLPLTVVHDTRGVEATMEEVANAMRNAIPKGGVLGGGSVGGAWGSLWQLVKSQIPAARINSTFRAGDPGYHGRGKAIDFGFGTGPGGLGSAGLASIKRLLHDQVGGNLAELIYNGVGNDRTNIKNGRPLAYSRATQLQHRNHVHAAVYDQGGVLPHGGVGINLSGSPERVLDPRETAAYEAGLRSREFSGGALAGGAPMITVQAAPVAIYLDGQEWRGMARVEAESVVVSAVTGVNRGLSAQGVR